MNWRVPVATLLFVLAGPVVGLVKGFVAGIYGYLALVAFSKKKRARA